MRYEVRKTAICLNDHFCEVGYVGGSFDLMNDAFKLAEELNTIILAHSDERCCCHYDVFEVE